MKRNYFTIKVSVIKVDNTLITETLTFRRYLYFRQIVLSAKCLFGKNSFRQIVRSSKCPSANCPFGKLSFGKMSFGKVSFGKMSGHRMKFGMKISEKIDMVEINFFEDILLFFFANAENFEKVDFTRKN